MTAESPSPLVKNLSKIPPSGILAFIIGLALIATMTIADKAERKLRHTKQRFTKIVKKENSEHQTVFYGLAIEQQNKLTEISRKEGRTKYDVARRAITYYLDHYDEITKTSQ